MRQPNLSVLAARPLQTQNPICLFLRSPEVELEITKKQGAASTVMVALIVASAFLLLAIPSRVQAQAPVQTAASSNYTTSGASATLTNPVTAGDAIIVLFQAVVTSGITAPVVTDSRGTPFTQSVAQGYYYSGNGYWCLNFIDCGLLPSDGPETVGVSLQNSGFRVEAIEVQGISCQNPYSSSGQADSGSSISTSTLVPFTSGGIAVASIIGNGVASSGSGYILLEALSGDNFVSEYSLSPSSPTNFPATNGSPGQPRYGGNFWLEVGAIYQPTTSPPVVTETVYVTQTVVQTYVVTQTVVTTTTASAGGLGILSDPAVLGFGVVIVALLLVMIALLARRPSVPH